MSLPEGWSYKTDESGGRQFVGDDPILIDGDGKETVLDVAKLYGDLRGANAESKSRKELIREYEEKLKAFDGVDPEEHQRLKRLAKKAKQATNASEGDPADLAAKLADLEEQIEALSAERETLNEKVTGLSTQNRELTVGRAFESDPHFAARNGSGPLTRMPPEIAQQMLGAYCKPGDNGEVLVFRDREHKDLIRGEDGKPASFSEAISKLGPQFPWWKSQLADKGGSGSSLEDAGGGSGLEGRKIKSKADLRSGSEKVAFIKQHGHEAFRDLPAT